MAKNRNSASDVIYTNATENGNTHSEITRTTNDSVLIDELLFFITNKLDILPPDVIVQLCTSTFSDSAIEVSKKKLFDLCADETNSRYRKRQGAKKSVMNIEDVIKLLQEKGSDVPKFVALDLSKLPPITFDSVDVSALLNTIKNTQNEVDILRATIESHNAVSDGLHSVSASLETRMSCMEKKMDDLSQGIAYTSTLAGSSNTAPVIAQVQASALSSGGSDTCHRVMSVQRQLKPLPRQLVVAAALMQKQLFLK